MMNSVVVEKFDFNSKRRLNTPLQNVRRFVSNKRKSRKSMYEKIPLTSPDTDSCSDEDITLHDIRHLRNDLNDTCENSLRKIKKLDQKRNGAVIENDKTSDPFQHCDFLYLKIEEGDTLQSISIKYQCAVSDLKRANNLISSQEFFGLKHLKIPVKKHSLLTEILKDTPETKSNSIIIEENCENVQTINIGIGSAGRCPSPQDSTAFFKRMDEDLVKIMLSTNTQKESLEAAAAALTTPQIQPLVKDPYNTVDCGIQWNYLILCIIIVAVIIPTAVALYMYTRSSHESEHHVYHNCSSSTESYSSAPELVTDKS
ncbi:lysM and putative peptidoglycan-binding domain-containing protein 3 [Caerostris darwini]|uniref:LysM and putative peptidoglycan-binding domain-containing protein 3 n=1 Tax=Caerostris darwini TaxID=1538125 RepID=A0AAV4TEQ0_9ARAC|nr:lysM and putative peptidoglycan-binding domain-containing protein 3 [Caerostris darwini]